MPGDCAGRGGTIAWPQTQAQPGALRLHDVGTSWSDLSTGSGTYDWTKLEAWLDVIAQHRPLAVIQVFSWVPCWDAPSCEAPHVAPTGTNAPPKDLTSTGSKAFNDFVTQFVQHCSPAGNCAGECPTGKVCASTNLIRFYEMWNEWNTTVRWSGTMNQMYEMLAPAVKIIRANVTNAVILTPSTTSGNTTTFQSWLNLETTNGRISDRVVWHEYLNDDTPEDMWAKYGSVYVSTQAALPAWKNVPWADTETNFDVNTYACPSKYSANDCTGQVVRWQLLHSSNGALNLNWYRWNQTIGSNPKSENAYYYMMQYLTGGRFGGPCTSNGSSTPTWTCNFTKSDGVTAAMWVWTPNESGTSFSVPKGFVDYMDLSGAKNTVNSGQSITIGPMPIMLEQ
jgi:hypothetical protein